MDHTFFISIDDGSDCYKYPLTIKDGENLSIRDIYVAMCERYDIMPEEGVYCQNDSNKKKG